MRLKRWVGTLRYYVSATAWMLLVISVVFDPAHGL